MNELNAFFSIESTIVEQTIIFIEIVFIDLVLAGDNAIIIGMVASQFDANTRKKIIFWGIGFAIILRIALTLVTTYLLQINGLKTIGGLLLIYVAYKLYKDVIKNNEDAKEQKIKTEKNESVSRITIRVHIAGGYELLSVINNIKKGNKKTEEVIQDAGNFFSWPEKKYVKKFIQSNKKYIEFRDFLSLVFYNPKKF